MVFFLFFPLFLLVLLRDCILQLGLQRFRDFPRPFWLALFVEGTRFTPSKLLAAQEYAASQGLPTPRNVLIPRTKVKNSTTLLFFLKKFSS